MSPLDLEELEASNNQTLIRERERTQTLSTNQQNFHDVKRFQSTPSSDDLKFLQESKERRFTLDQLSTANRNSSAARKPPRSNNASMQSPVPKKGGLAPKMSPELTQVLMMNVQAFEENAISAHSGDK